MSTAGSSPTTQASWPGATSTTAGAARSTPQPSPYSKCSAPCGEEADVGVLAALGADERSEVDGPAHAGRVDGPLDPGVADLGEVDLDGPERLVRRPGMGVKSASLIAAR